MFLSLASFPFYLLFRIVVLNLSCPGHGDHALSCTVRAKLNDPDTDPNLSTGVRAIPLHV